MEKVFQQPARLYQFDATISANRVDETNKSRREQLQKINQNNYFLSDSYGQTPQVLIFGYTHDGYGMHQEEDISKVMNEILEENDIMILEGNNLKEVSPDEYHKLKQTRKIKNKLLESNSRVIFNDKLSLAAKTLIYGQELKKRVENDEKEEVRELEKKLHELLEERDKNFVFNPTAGLLPLLNNTAKNGYDLKTPSKIILLVGIDHVLAGNINKNLKKEGINYRTYLPEFHG